MAERPRVLISGGSGFIGEALRCRLAKIDCSVTIIRRLGKEPLTLRPRETELVIDWPSRVADIAVENFDFFFYLSHSPVSESMTIEEVMQVNLRPLQEIAARMRAREAFTHLIFISSQSANQSVKSKYGELKRLTERYIEENVSHATIIRPGLIVGYGKSGLFNSLVKFIRSFPLIPLLGKSSDLIQPIYMDDFIEICLRSSGLKDGRAASGIRKLEVALDPISFHVFVKQIATELKLKRFFLVVPTPLILFGLWFCEKILNFKSFTSSSVLGFLQLSTLDSVKCWKEFGFTPVDVSSAIRLSLFKASDATRSDIYEISEDQKTETVGILISEVKYFCPMLLKRAASDQLIDAYIRAHFKRPFSLFHDSSVIKKIVDLGLDAVSLEFSNRRKLKSLTLKLQLICYLAENLTGYESSFFLSQDNTAKSFLTLVYEVLRSFYQFLKGKILTWRYGLV